MARGFALGVAIVSCLSFITLLDGCKKQSQTGAQGEPLLCYVGGTMRPAMEEIAKMYKEETGVDVLLDQGDSGELIGRIETEKKGDLYVCHDPFLAVLMNKDLGTKGWTIATLTPVIVVAKGNPKGIHSLQDLARPGLSLIMTDYQYSTLGNMLPTIFKKAGVDLEKLKETNIKKTTRSGGEAANNVAIGEYDAAICWNAVAALRPDKLDVIPISKENLPTPGVDAITSATGKVYEIGHIKVTIATLKFTTSPDKAARFAEYVASPKGAAVFAKLGFSPVPESLTQPVTPAAGK